MLSKLDDTVIYEDTTVKNIYTNNTEYNSSGGGDSNGSHTKDTDIGTLSINEDGVYSFSITRKWWSNSASCYIQLISIETWITITWVSISASTESATVTSNKYIKKWIYTIRLHFTYYVTSSAFGTITVNNKSIDLVWYNLYKNFALIALPKQTANIWVFTTVVLFWEKDRDFYLGREVTTASTGAITPWNFVWYIKIWKYKIPYYL